MTQTHERNTARTRGRSIARTGGRSIARGAARALPVASLLLAGALLTGCSGSSSDSADSGGKASPSPTSPQDRALAYAQCMRDNGVANFPDPSDGGSIKIGPGDGLDPNSSEFKKAREACQDLSPQGQNAGGGTIDPAKAAEWAKCVREHGVPGFPDPEINGGSMQIDMSGLDPQSSTFQSAMQACQAERPAGGIMIKGGGGGR
ncbi:hypothetical protein ABZ484_11705 [Streptomyces sp. NPDC006393]|uniref:hypothetical protein n=1 Tax=Streptomyces sp. NPDC006393 TaxID=3156763 RepID=UPI0034001AA1